MRKIVMRTVRMSGLDFDQTEEAGKLKRSPVDIVVKGRELCNSRGENAQRLSVKGNIEESDIMELSLLLRGAR